MSATDALCPVCKERPATVPVAMTATINGEEKEVTTVVCRPCALDLVCGR